MISLDTTIPSNWKPIKPKDNPLSEQAAEQIRNYIVENHLTSGDKLPSEPVLMEMLKVSRGTIREAVKLLLSRNILEIRRGLGTFISARPGQIEDPFGFSCYADQKRLCMDLLEVRLHLEPWLASAVAQRATEEEKTLLQEKCRAVERDILSGEDYRANDVQFHLFVGQCTQNVVVPYLGSMISYSEELLGKLLGRVLLAESIIEHRGIADAICRRDSETAKQMMRRHLDQTRAELEKDSQLKMF